MQTPVFREMNFIDDDPLIADEENIFDKIIKTESGYGWIVRRKIEYPFFIDAVKQKCGFTDTPGTAEHYSARKRRLLSGKRSYRCGHSR